MPDEALQAAFEIKAACDDISRKLLRWHWEEKPGAHSVDALMKHLAQRQKESPDYYERLPELNGRTGWQQLDTTLCMRILLDPEKDAARPLDQLMVPFLALMAVISLIVLLLMKLSLPDIQGTRVEKGEKLEKSVWSFRHLTLGVVAIFFYVGVEVCIGANINLYAIEMDYASPALMATLYWGGMLVGRLVGSSLSRISPRVQLTVTTVSAGLLALLAILLNNPWLLTAVGLFHSIMWGAIFTLSVAHLGKYTSVASGVFMIGVVGGAILPLLQGVLADVLGGWRWSWFIVLFGEAFMLYYALIGSRVRQTCDNL